MDSVPRTQADVLGLPLLEGLGGGEESQVVLTSGEGGAVWRSANMDSLTLVHSYNLPPPSQQELAQQVSHNLSLLDLVITVLSSPGCCQALDGSVQSTFSRREVSAR